MSRIFFAFIFTSNIAFASCNFKSADYIDELTDPSQIDSIQLDIPKSAGYVKNALKIINSNSENIPPKLKKRFKAVVTVNYKFGSCKYQAKVSQSGDYKDHLQLRPSGDLWNAELRRSLDIKLLDGNILSSVRFKLLLPKTRNYLNEILAALLLRRVGFLVPETFGVKTKINNVESIMLFQEKSAKELLEKNKRREGPIFEGDESLIWSFREYKNFELEALSLARLVNDNWFMMGPNSQQITLKAFARIQRAYLTYAWGFSLKRSELSLFANSRIDDKFINYHSIMLAMNAEHGLRPHNRKFYFNSISDEFEPIYYDGNPNFLRASSFTEVEKLVPRRPSLVFLKTVEEVLHDPQFMRDFLKRVVHEEHQNLELFFLESISWVKKNLRELFKAKFAVSTNKFKEPIPDLYRWYWENVIEKRVGLKVIEKLGFESGVYNAHFISGGSVDLSDDLIAQVLSGGKVFNQKFIYLPPLSSSGFSGKNLDAVKIDNIHFTKSPGISINVDHQRKEIHFFQSNAADWVLVSNSDLTNWGISFHGIDADVSLASPSQQRINEFGLTGCLNIYRSVLDDARLEVLRGRCEDGVNIISSIGKGIVVRAKHAFADAIDADFSELSFVSIDIKGAGNDCIDFSSGNYSILAARLYGCSDKGISVGERSIMQLAQGSIESVGTGLAVKDMSKAQVESLSVDESSTCIEVLRKKQEFGGGTLSVNKLNCESLILVDAESNLAGLAQK